MSNMVSWSDYEGVEGFGAAAFTQEHVDELNKALLVGQDINAPAVAPGEGFPMRVESLEKTMKVTTFKATHLRLFRSMSKLPAFNTVEEFNLLTSYGDNRDAGWIDEGDLPEEADSTYERKTAIVRYLGTQGRVSLQASLIKPAHGNLVAQETVNKTMHLLEMVERGLFYGRNDLSSLQFDGFEKLMRDNCPTNNIVDLRGQPLSEDNLTDGALTISDAPNYGQATNLHANPKVLSDLNKTFFPKERHNTFTDKTGTIGLNIKAFTSMSGDILFEPNVFIQDGGGPPAAAVGDATKRPGIPTVTAALAAAGSGSEFTADDAGDYRYDFVACNRYGKSAAVACSGSVLAITEGQQATVGVTPGGSITVSWYELYRSLKNGADGSERLIMRIPNTTGLAEMTLTDTNAYLPYCTSAFMFQQNLEAMSVKQLAPMMKIPLAIIDLTIRWAQAIFMTPILYTPGKVLLFENVGRATGYVGAP